MTQLETPTKTPKPSRNLQKVRKDLELLRKARAEAAPERPVVLSTEFVEDSDEEIEQTPEQSRQKRAKFSGAGEPVEDPAPAVETEMHDVVAEVAEIAMPDLPPTPSSSGRVSVDNVEQELHNASFLYNYRRQGVAHYTSMIGGSYTVPIELRESFLRQYYQEFIQWLAHTPLTKPGLFLTQRYNAEYFRFFVDIDYEWTDETPPVLDTIHHLQKAVTDMLAYLNDGALYEIEVRPSDRTTFKRHFVFPQVIVSPTNCLLFAQSVERLMRLHCDLNVVFDMKVYQRGSLRMLGSCKRSGLVSSHVNETEFFYMPIDPITGKRQETLTYEEFERHSILLDKDSHDRVERFMASHDGVVYMPRDEDFNDDLFVTCKHIHSGPTNSSENSSEIYAVSNYTGPNAVAQGSPLYSFLEDRFGAQVASNANQITHDPRRNAIFISLDKNSTYCTLIDREHTSNHGYLMLASKGLWAMCYSTNDDRCTAGGKLVPFEDLPAEVAGLLPDEEECVASIEANADITTLRGQAELLHADFVRDGLLADTDDHNLIMLSLSGTHRDVANLIKPSLSDEFVCVEADTQRWYHYRHPLWRYKEAKNDVKEVIAELPKVYTRYIHTYYKNFRGKEKVRKQRIDTILRVKNKVSDNQFKDKVGKELASMSLDVRFEQRLDENRSLIGFNNGVFDMEKREFRAGEPSDLVSMTTGYDFPTQSSPVHRAVLDKLMEDTQPEEANRNYLKKNLASCLAPGNTFELFHIWAGTTRNGKSVVALLITIALGSTGYNKENGELSKYPYACPFEPSFLTADRSASSSTPSPEVIAARLARVLIGSEPERGQKINSAFMKKLTGNDLLSGRLLFSNEIVTFPPRFQLLLICNDIPSMDFNEMAVWKRSRVVDFPVTFVDNPQKPNERQIDELLKDKLLEDMNYRKEFMLMLIEWYYDLYLVEGMRNPPACVLKATRVYQEKSVLIGGYWGVCITSVDPSMHKHLCLDCILQDFRKRADSQEAYAYTQAKMKVDLTDTLGVKVNDNQTRCSNCPRKKQGVKNIRFSDARLAEKEEENTTGVAVDAGVSSCI